uniref:Helitron helicase-like domain-containing protein n=1 Tax=Lactuca sativa TaxID=4236 RepID=A0A9R1UR45_LACSA|nr:hypothetical protein LSAT_V11C800443640 [Lactuca sativa]
MEPLECTTTSDLQDVTIGNSTDDRDIIITNKSGNLQRINELHPTYLVLQYPPLFPYGDDGYRVDIPHRGVTRSTNSKRHKVNIFSLILNSRRLFQQFLDDAYTMIESERQYYIRNQQKFLRCESYENLCSMKYNGNTDIQILDSV